MREIPLSQGLTALVSDEDYEEVSQHGWYAVQDGHRCYASRALRRDGLRTTQKMHRFIMNPDSQSAQVDHIDGNGLNNQRSNLRLATNAQNQHNRGGNKNNTSGFKGVTCYGRKWRARIDVNGKQKHLGYFESSQEAARAYDKAALELHGEFAWLNFPGEVI